MKKNRNVPSCFLTLALLFSLACFAALPVSAESAPLRLTAEYDRECGSVTLTVVTTEELTLSNYDLRLNWDQARFTLTGIQNGQPERFPNFQANRQPGSASLGRVAAASGGENVTVSAESVLVIYCFSSSELQEGRFDFTVTVRDAADENGDPLTWKGSAVSTNLEIATPLTEILRLTAEGSNISCEAICSVSGASLFCAGYDASGRLLCVRILPVNADGSPHVYSTGLSVAEPGQVRVFLTGPDLAPLCAPGEATA